MENFDENGEMKNDYATTHARLSIEEKKLSNIKENLIRISVPNYRHKFNIKTQNIDDVEWE